MFENIDPRSPVPLWEQIAARVRIAVASGDLAPADALPSVRELARRLRVNPATVAQAYRELAAQGFAESRHGAGTFVREIPTEEKTREMNLGARVLVRGLLEDAARLGIPGEALVRAFQDEVGRTDDE
jgi:GntR family transcriptional regulator